MVDPIFSADVAAGKIINDTMTFMKSDLENNGIETIQNIELTFHIFDSDSWDTYLDTESISVNIG